MADGNGLKLFEEKRRELRIFLHAGSWQCNYPIYWPVPARCTWTSELPPSLPRSLFSHLWVASCEQFCSLALFLFYNAQLRAPFFSRFFFFFCSPSQLGGTAVFFTQQLRSLTSLRL